ncbi:monocarboxylate transporter 13 [Osmerus eperlanus]|uniref:monocarboxylate transporter 13 n=1 Tax=Osmerus eperlanus TaxID=29151 RepID=UPI002E1501F1
MKNRKSSGPLPPDGGYGWVVVTSAFFIMGLTAAVSKNFGLFFMEIQTHFGILTSTLSWVNSTAIAMFHLGAPLASALSLRFGHRWMIMLGGLLIFSGMLLASLSTSLTELFLGIGVLQGLGLSFCWTPANSMVSHYFLRWRPIAYAIASAGECVFAMMFSPFFQWLIDTYTWQGALLLIGGLQLNLCVCGAVMRPLDTLKPQIPELNTETTADTPVVVIPPKEKPSFQWSLLRKPELVLYILFAIFAAAGFFIPPLFLVPYASSLGLGQYWAASILSVMALVDLGGRLACGWLANMRLIRNLQLVTMVATLLGVVLLLLPISQNYWSLLVFSSLYGFFYGSLAAVHVTAIVDIVGLSRFDSGLGLFMLFRSIGGFLGPPAAGWLVDWTEGFDVSFYLSGISLIVSGVFVALVDHLVRKRDASSDDQEPSSDPEASAGKTGEKPEEILNSNLSSEEIA